MRRRDSEMIESRRAGDTLDEVAERHGVSRQRVYQITAAYVSGDAAASARARRERERVALNADVVRADYRAGRDPADIAQLRGLQRASLDEWLSANITDADRGVRRAARPRPTSVRRYSDGDLIEAIRRAHRELGHLPTANEWQRNVQTREGFPSVELFTQRFGSWNAAIRRAGFPTRHGRPEYARRWTADDCLRHVRRCADVVGHMPTYAQYDAWARLDSDAPSGQTVRNRLHVPWSGVLSEALSPVAVPT